MDGDARRRRRHDRVRHGHRQARRALGLPRRGRRVARRLLPGGRPRGPRRRAGRGRPLLPRRGRRAAAVLRRRRTSRSTRSPQVPRRSAPRGAGRADGAAATRRGCRRRKLATALARLEDAGAVEIAARRRRSSAIEDAPARDAVARAPPRPRSGRRELERSRVDMVRAYAETARLPARVPALLLRRAVRAAVRALRQLRLGAGARAARPDVPFAARGAGRAPRSGARASSSATSDDAMVVALRRGRATRRSRSTGRASAGCSRRSRRRGCGTARGRARFP